jgi:hypothetical protein
MRLMALNTAGSWDAFGETPGPRRDTHEVQQEILEARDRGWVDTWELCCSHEMCERLGDALPLGGSANSVMAG